MNFETDPEPKVAGSSLAGTATDRAPRTITPPSHQIG